MFSVQRITGKITHRRRLRRAHNKYCKATVKLTIIIDDKHRKTRILGNSPDSFGVNELFRVKINQRVPITYAITIYFLNNFLARLSNSRHLLNV